ncbi:hypothetical protein INT47_008944 [Mucor saturninus]|uniref:RRM domain-containing protein n=1 Tax=Mucor saturninus TaxID=64648 RepID=A0A8H7V2C9_9FUNG|nr:hypothetical protein INT47_008944 [Mucor saturninus]
MKRHSDISQAALNEPTVENKRPRYAPSGYGDVYTQYGMMAQIAHGSSFPQPTPQSQYAIMSQYAQGSPFGQPPLPENGYGHPLYSMYGASHPSTASIMGGEATRTIYLGNVTKEMKLQDIFNYVRHGVVESFRTCYEKNCAFLAFVEPSQAQKFFQEYLTKKITVNNINIKLGWGKPTTIPITLKIQIQGGATRCVYLGRINDTHTEEFIREAASQYGPLEQIKILAEKNIAFVHFLSIMAAAKCVGALSKEPGWEGVKVNYGKDRCANYFDYSNPYGFQNLQQTQQQQQQQHLAYDPFCPYSPQEPIAGPVIGADAASRRTLYLGNIHPDAKTEDLCNIIRGGNLVKMKFIQDKHIAFVTFLDAMTAMSVYNYARDTGLVIRGRKLRVGFGKPSSISTHVARAIQQGATRNVYIGNIPNSLTVEKLKEDFSSFGEIELVNAFMEKRCAFVNFVCIENAVLAIHTMRSNPDYSGYTLNYGKDRCGNPYKPSSARKPVADAPPHDTSHPAHNTTDATVTTAAATANGDVTAADADAIEATTQNKKHVDEHEDGAITTEKPTSIVDDIPEPPPPSTAFTV